MAEVIQPATLDTAPQMGDSVDPVAVSDELQGILNQGRQSVEKSMQDSRNLALMSRGLNGADVMATQAAYLQDLKAGMDPEQEKLRLQEEYILRTDQQIIDTVRNSATSDDPDVRQATTDLIIGRDDFIKTKVGEALDYDGGARTIKELFVDESASDFTMRRQIQKEAAFGLVSEWADQRGTLNAIVDFTTTMFAVDTWSDWGDLTGKGVFASAEDVSAFVQDYQSLDPEEQAVAFPDLLAKIIDDYDDNEFKVAGLVAIMHSRDAYGDLMFESVMTAFNAMFAPADVWAAGKLITGAGKLLRGGKGTEVELSSLKADQTQQPDVPADVTVLKEAAKQNSVPHGMMQLRNETAAAETMTIAGLDGEAGKAMGATRFGAADTAVPFRNGELPIMIDSIDTIADSMVKAHRAQIQEVMVARQLEATKLVREGESAVTLGAAKRLVTLPRRVERLKKDIKVLDRTIQRIKAGKPTKNNTAVQKQLEVLSRELDIRVQKLAVTRNLLKASEETVAGRKALDRVNYDILELESGRLPANLSDSIKTAIDHRAQQLVVAQQRVAKTRETVRVHAADTADSVAPETAALMLRSKIAEQSPRVLDDPLRYGLSEDFAADTRELVRDPMNDLIAETDELALEKFTNSRRKEIQDRVVAKIVKEGKDAGNEVKVGEIIQSGDEGFRVIYRTNNVDEVFEYEYKMNDAGIFEGTGLVNDSLISHMGKLLSPSALFHDLGRFVNNLTFAGDQSAKIGKRLQDMHKEIHKGLSVAQKKELDSLLIYGDEQGRVFHIDELSAGTIETRVSHKPHDAATIQAYYRLRALYDEMHDMRDFFIRKDLNFAGYKDISYVTADGESVRFLGRPLEDFKGQDLSDVKSIFTPGGDTEYMPIGLLRETMQEWKDGGYKLVELYEPHVRIVKGKEELVTKYAMVADDFGAKIGDMPQKVLSYSPGYIPRVYRKGYSFVKDMRSPSRPITAFATETLADAQRFRDQLNAFAGGDVYVAKGDRELTRAERLVMDADSYGGLYTGNRSRRELLVRTSDGGYRPERIGNGEATARYMSNLASLMPVAEYRHTLMRQWANTVDHLAAKENRLGLTDKTDFASEIDLSPQKKAMMESARDYIKTQLKLQTDEEKFLNHTLMKMSDALYAKDSGKGRQLVRAMTQGMIDKDPIQQLKGFTFNLQLGMFNPRQLIVQAQNAVIAASISPQHAPGALADALAMRTFVLATDAQLPGLMKATAQATGRNLEELQALVTDFKKTGLWDSIKQNADFDASVVSLGGNTMAKVRTAASAGRIFFREGELMARLMSFNIARRRLGPKATSQELFDEHLRLSMNMQSANAASWQKNWLGVPLQYMQVFTKFYESLIPGLLFDKFGKGKWTPKEAYSVLAGQVAMYGTIGIPVAEDAYGYLADQLGITPKQAQEEYPWVEKSLSQGMTGFMAQVMGIEANFSEALSIVGGTADTNMVQFAKAMYDGVVSGGSDIDLSRALSGPSITTLGRTSDAIRAMGTAAQTLAHDPSLEVLGSQVLEVADAFAGMTSTWSNARKVIFLHDIGLVSKQGNTIFSKDEFSDINLQTSFARAMGFQTDVETAYWSLKDVNRTTRQNQKDDLSAMKAAHNEYMKGGSYASYKAKLALVREGKTFSEWSNLKDSVIKGITGDSDYDRQANAFLEQYITSGGKTRLHPATSQFGDR